MLKTIRNLLAVSLFILPLAANAGVKYLGHDDLTDVGRLSFGTGAAVDGTKYQLARTNDATNALFLNSPSSSPIQLGVNGAALFTINPVATVGAWFNFLQGNVNGNTPVAFKLTAGDHTALAVSTEATDVYFDLSRTVQFATGALTNQRAFRIDAPTYAFVGASIMSAASTVSIDGMPLAGANATMQFSTALNVSGTNSNATQQATGVNISPNGKTGSANLNNIIDLNVSDGVANVTLGSGGTINSLYRQFIGSATYDATAAVTVSNAPASLYIEGPQVASTNVTFNATSRSLIVASGTSEFAGDTYVSDGFGVVIGGTTQVSLAPLAATELEILGTGFADSSATFGRWSANAFTGQLNFIKSRNATIGSFTIVQDNDEVGAIAAFPDDGVDYGTEAARYVFEVDDASPAAGDIGMAHVWYTMAGGGAAISEKMRLSASGQLSIKTLSLDVGTGAGQATLDGSTGGCIMLRDTDDAGWTECDALDGVLSCSIDVDGICD